MLNVQQARPRHSTCTAQRWMSFKIIHGSDVHAFTVTVFSEHAQAGSAAGASCLEA
jgi:hypothetical protein